MFEDKPYSNWIENMYDFVGWIRREQATVNEATHAAMVNQNFFMHKYPTFEDAYKGYVEYCKKIYW